MKPAPHGGEPAFPYLILCLLSWLFKAACMPGDSERGSVLPDSVSKTSHSVLDKGPRAGEVYPEESLSCGCSVLLAAGDIEPGLLPDELLQIGPGASCLPAVSPEEIGRLCVERIDFRDVFPDEVYGIVLVGPYVGVHLVEPLPAFLKCCYSRGYGKEIGLAALVGVELTPDLVAEDPVRDKRG